MSEDDFQEMNNFIKEITWEAIGKYEDETIKYVDGDTLMDIFRRNYDVLTAEKLPKSGQRYLYISYLLERGGRSVSVEQIGHYLSVVKRERTDRKGKKS